MRRFVVDASVAIKWFLPDAPDETNTPEALQLLRDLNADALALVQPPHWKAEIASVLARRVPDLAGDCLDDLERLEGIEIIDAAPVYRRAVELARTLEHHLFDTLYHATALELGISLITADRRYHDKASRLGGIMLLEAIRAPGANWTS